MSYLDLFYIGFYAVCGYFAIVLLRERKKLDREIAQWNQSRIKKRRDDLRRLKAREDALNVEREARAQRIRADEAKRFQIDIATFPSHGNYFGQPFSVWQEQFQDLVDRGLSLDRPSEHFSRLKKAVIDGLAFNHDRVALASLVSDPNTQVSLAFASHHVADAQACLHHLQSIEAKWAQDRFDAMDQATAPAMGVSKRAGRL